MERTINNEGGRVTVKKKNNRIGYLLVLPCVLGAIIFNFLPMALCLAYSFFDYDIITPPRNFGIQNYTRIFTDEILFDKLSKSVLHTGQYLVFSIAVGLILSFLLALFLNQKIKGMAFYRVLYYLPVLLPPICSAIIWADITDPLYGLGNALLLKLGLPEYTFYSDYRTAMPTYLILSLWGLGSNLMLWIAQFQNIPDSLYEAAELEGAGWLRKTCSITIPMSTPTIFYTLINCIISGLQSMGPYLVVGSGPDDSLLFYVSNIYITYRNFNMGLACSLSWMLFIVIALLTLLLFKKSKWVFYGEDM